MQLCSLGEEGVLQTTGHQLPQSTLPLTLLLCQAWLHRVEEEAIKQLLCNRLWLHRLG